MSDFSPEMRRTALWSGHARKIYSGHSAEVYLEQIGEFIPEDISEKENVRMGHVMEPVIARLASDRLDMRVNHADYMIRHAKHDFLASHFDYINDARDTLLECKNYTAAVRNKFGDDGEKIIPVSDYAQCLHEATVHDIDRVILCVLFGGQEFVTFPLEFGEQEKIEHVKRMAEVWAMIRTKTPPSANTIDAAKILYASGIDGEIVATKRIEEAAAWLKERKALIKKLESEAEEADALIRDYMKEKNTLIDFKGDVLATWKNRKEGEFFDSKLFNQYEPEHYAKYVVSKPGPRTFLLKK